jgi:hypothetical protein
MNKEAYETGLPFIQKAEVDHKIDFIQSDALSAINGLIDVSVFFFFFSIDLNLLFASKT